MLRLDRDRRSRWRSCARAIPGSRRSGSAEGDDVPPIVSLWSWHDSMVTPQTLVAR